MKGSSPRWCLGILARQRTSSRAPKNSRKLPLIFPPSSSLRTKTARAPVKQPTLAALVSWWEHGRSLPAVLAPPEAARIAEAIGAVAPQLDGTPWAATVDRLEVALRDAARRREPLLVDLARSDGSVGSDGARHGSSGSPGSSGRANRPSGPDGKSTTATTASGSSAP